MINNDEMGFILGGFATNDDVLKSNLKERSMFSINTLATTISFINLLKKRGNNEHVIVECSKR